MTAYNWTNAADNGRWDDAANWQPNGVPQAADDVTIPDADANGATWPNGPLPPPITLKSLDMGNLGFSGGGPVTVTDTLTWHGGPMACDLTLLGTGVITGLYGLAYNPGVLNGSKLTVTGTLTIQGLGDGQNFWISTGSSLINTGTVNLVGAGLGAVAGGGNTVTNDGTINVSGACSITRIAISNDSVLSIPAGSTLLIGVDATLRLSGGTVVGTGQLSVGDGQGGEIDIVKDTSVANLTVGPNGTVAPEAGAADPSPVLPGALTVTKNLIWSGPVPPNVGYSTVAGHVVLAPAATATVSNAVTLGDGQIDNAGHITLAAGSELGITATAIFSNSGILTLSDTGGTAQGLIGNTGLIDKTGAGTAKLGSAVSNTGSIAVRAGTLQVGDGTWTISQGQIAMAGGSISQDGLGAIVLAGGTSGGVLVGSGSVAAVVRNGGWIEPAGAGLTFTNGFEQQVNGNLVLPAAVWTGSASKPLVTIGGAGIALGGSLWSLAGGPAGGPATRELIKLSGPWAGAFSRVRARNDDTRLNLTFPAAGAVGAVTGEMKAAPAFYGLDFKNCPKPDALNKSAMQQLFENTLLSFVGFYLGPVNASWRAYGATTLAGQGWALLPAYFGYQQEQDPQQPVNVIPENLAAAKAQGAKDGAGAVRLATATGLDRGSIIYLDIETAHKIQPQTFAYIDAWAGALTTDGTYRPGVYCSANTPNGADGPTCDVIRDQDQHNLAFWPFRLPSRTETWLSGGPLDANHDPVPLAFGKPSGSSGTWDFTGYAEAWQFCQDWSAGDNVIYTDTGQQLRLSTIHKDFDFDVGRVPDPGNTAGGKPKGRRRRKVTAVAADAQSITSGSTAKLTITIDGPAAEPDGLLVLIRSSLPEVVAPSAVRVLAGKTEATAMIGGHVAAGQVTSVLSARALHQLSGALPTVDLTVTPPA